MEGIKAKETEVRKEAEKIYVDGGLISLSLSLGNYIKRCTSEETAYYKTMMSKGEVCWI